MKKKKHSKKEILDMKVCKYHLINITTMATRD